jgi:hypothetical protein
MRDDASIEIESAMITRLPVLGSSATAVTLVASAV